MSSPSRDDLHGAVLSDHAPATRRPALIAYLARLNIAQRVLWCYLIWYLEVIARYFDPNLRLWLSSVGISSIVGTGLYLSTAHAGAVRTYLSKWQVMRLYVTPFCVSSFAALIKDRGFILIFHPTLSANLHALTACGAFLGVCHWLKRSS